MFSVLTAAKTTLLLVVLMVTSENCQLAHAFWLTDGITFVTRQQSADLKDANGSPVLVVEQTPELLAATSTSGPAPVVEQVLSTAPSTTTSKTPPAIISWILDSTAGFKNSIAGQQSAGNIQPATAEANNSSSIYAPTSQCQTDWLESQTNSWLNKWLTSETFCNQVRLAISSQTNSALSLSNSTGAARPPPSGGATDQAKARDQSTTRRRSWFGLGGGKQSGAANKSAAGAAATRHHNSHSASSGRGKSQQQQATVRLVPGERGPKGEQGAKGERGPSGLTTVKDRDALFDLPAAGGSASAQPVVDAANHDRRLVFVESEQMLVVNTSIGWRPVQMAAPLSDFRKTIAKFNLNNPDDRRRLLLLKSVDSARQDDADELAGSSLKRTATNHHHHRVGGGGDDSNWVTNRAKRIESPTGAASFELTNDLRADADDAEDDDDEDDDDVDDDDENSIDLDDEDDEAADEDDDDDDDEAGDEATNAIASASGDIDRYSSSRSNLIGPPPNSFVQQQQQSTGGKRHQRAQVSSRSSAASYGSPNSDGKLNHNLKKLRLIALNEPISGNVHGLRGANFECKRNAAKANIKGAFRAFLATSYQNLNEVVRHNTAGGQKYPVVNLRNEILATSWWDLFKQPARLANPLSRVYSFDGRHVATDPKWPNKLVWHGTGSKLGHRNSLHNCDGWHSDSMNKFGYASPLHSPRHFAAHKSKQTRQQKKRSSATAGDTSPASVTNSSVEQPTFLDSIEKYPCRMPLVVLCIETVAQVD